MKKRILAVAALTLTAAVSCGDGVLPESGAVVYHSPAQVESLSPQPVVVPGRSLTPEQREQYAPILESFEQNASELLRRADIEARLEQIETVFIVSGRYFELLAIFQKDVATHGLGTPAAPALVWGYLQIGQRKLAREMLDAMKGEYSESALVWLLEGSYWLLDVENSTTAARRAKESFEKALELEPEFPTFRRLNASVLRQQIRELERRLPADTVRDVALVPVEEVAVEEVAVEEVAVEEVAVEEVAVEKAPVEEIAEAAAPEAPAPPKAAILVARGQLLMARGDDQLAEAQSFFQQALGIDPENLDAAMGLLFVAARSGAPHDMLRAQVERIEGYDHLTARQAYDLGLFSARTLKNGDLATRLLTRSSELDADHAERVGIKRLLENL